MNRASYDSSCALIVVDVQNDFARPEGALYVSGGEDIVAVINEEIREALEAGALVVYTQEWHPPETPHFQAQGGLWPAHCVQGTWGSEL
nr:isochorismatase family protein [Actinomycetota bacterium]